LEFINMQMHVIATDLGSDWAGPYTDKHLLEKTFAIIKKVDPDAEILSREANPFSEQILSGMQPYKIHVDIVGGEPQLPAEVSLTWPPAQSEGIQTGTQEYTEYFVWASNEKEALLRLARLNKAIPKAVAEAA
jgi:hypothetical protein